MEIYVVLKLNKKSGKATAVASFTDLRIASKFRKNMEKIAEEGIEYNVVTTLLLDCNF